MLTWLQNIWKNQWMTQGHVITRTDEDKKNVRSMGMLNTFFVLAWRSGVKPAQSAMSTDGARNLAPPRGPYNLHGPLAVEGRQTGALTASPITSFVSCEVRVQSRCTIWAPSTWTNDLFQVGTELWKSSSHKSSVELMPHCNYRHPIRQLVIKANDRQLNYVHSTESCFSGWSTNATFYTTRILNHYPYLNFF